MGNNHQDHECEQLRPGTGWRHHPGPLQTSHLGSASQQFGTSNLGNSVTLLVTARSGVLCQANISIPGTYIAGRSDYGSREAEGCMKWPWPKDRHELRHFLGMCTYYHVHSWICWYGKATNPTHGREVEFSVVSRGRNLVPHPRMSVAEWVHHLMWTYLHHGGFNCTPTSK
jgi:hypothetical protein